jgi:hypothetical protein
VHLRFEMAGYEPTTYDVHPESEGLVFVELHRTGRAPAAPSASPAHTDVTAPVPRPTR